MGVVHRLHSRGPEEVIEAIRVGEGEAEELARAGEEGWFVLGEGAADDATGGEEHGGGECGEGGAFV